MQVTTPAIRRRRKIKGMSAILLPFDPQGNVDWAAFTSHVERTVQNGLIPAVNMDTGYAHLIGDEIRREALSRTQVAVSGGAFVAGAMVKDQPGDSLDLSGYQSAMDEIQDHGGTPIIFQSYGLTQGGDPEIVEAYRKLSLHCDRFYAFELGTMFAPFGEIYSLEVYRQLMAISACVGAKHSSLQRAPEWQRLALRDECRPDFEVLTGNDLAIDMVMYGSDYLLGLSTFAPDLFARRDQMWEQGDSGFYELNDVLQYLGFFAFRHPTPAYKHSAAMFLNQRGWINSSLTHPGSTSRPASDQEVLFEIGRQLGLEMKRL